MCKLSAKSPAKSFQCKRSKMELADVGKLSSLLRQGMNYERKKFYGTILVAFLGMQLQN